MLVHPRPLSVRRLPPIWLPALAAAALITAVGCGAAMAKQAAAPTSAMGAMAPVDQASTTTTPGDIATQLPKEQLVVEGQIGIEVDDVTRTTADTRTQAEAMGGRVIRESMSGGAQSWTGMLEVRLPPDRVEPFVAWLTRQGEITRKEIRATDVSRTLFDQQIALDNLKTTLDRLRQLYQHEGLTTADILEIEKEMTRIRLEIERIEGEKRFLEDRVAYATLDIDIARKEGAILGPKAKFYPGVRGSALILLDPEGRDRVRMGIGGVVHAIPRFYSFQIDVYGERDDEKRAVIATTGGAAYSDFLGRGKRQFLNPYLGGRLGYAYLDGHNFVLEAEAGIELFKHEFVMVDADVRLLGLFGEVGADMAVVTGGSVVVAF